MRTNIDTIYLIFCFQQRCTIVVHILHPFSPTRNLGTKPLELHNGNSKGVDIYTIAKVLGHSDVGNNRKIYVHNGLDVLRKNMNLDDKRSTNVVQVSYVRNFKVKKIKKRAAQITEKLSIHAALLSWCARRDLNPYVIQHTPLKRACLPIPALARLSKSYYIIMNQELSTLYDQFLKILSTSSVNSL